MNPQNTNREDNDICQIPFQFRGRSSALHMERCSGRDQVVRQIEAKGWQSYEAPLPATICELLATGASTFIDIGANSGFYSLIAALSGCQDIRAFEPVPFIAALMKRNYQHTFGLQPDTIKIFQTALSDSKGSAEFYMPGQGHGLVETSASLNPRFRQNHSDKFIVNTTTLDAHIQSHPLARNSRLVIKIDVESLEENVLRGSMKTIAARRPTLLVEILPGPI